MSFAMRVTTGRIACIALALSVAATSVGAQEEPLWELGVGVSAFTVPDYIGSDEQTYLGGPFPYVVYRGEKVKVDREAIRGRLLTTDRLRLELSMSGSLPVDSDDNDAREGMPDLDLIGEIGPRLLILLHDEPGKSRFSIVLPIHAVFALDFDHISHEGWSSTPGVWYTGRLGKWHLEAWLGFQFADQGYNGYFYEVDPEFVTPERRAYRADGGFGGLRSSIGVSRRIGSFWYGAFTRFADINGATFSDSPLVKEHQGFTAGLAMAWVFWESEETVPVSLE